MTYGIDSVIQGGPTMSGFLRELFPRIKIRVGVWAKPCQWEMGGPVDDRHFDNQWHGPEDSGEHVGARDIREWLLSIETPEDALAFYRKTNVSGPYRFKEIKALQNFVEEASRTKISDWPKFEPSYPEEWMDALTEPPWIRLIWENEQPMLECDASTWGNNSIQHAIGSFLQLEALMGKVPNTCNRRECQNTWAYSDSRTDKKYCSRNCANVGRRRELRDAKGKK